MTTRIGSGLLLVCWMVVPVMTEVSRGQGPATPPRSQYQNRAPAKQYQYRPPHSARTGVNQQQAVRTSQNPTLHRHVPQSPFQLSAQEAAQLDQVLVAWEQRSDRVKKFECKFTRLIYDQDSSGETAPDKPTRVDQGVIKYAAPDKGLFRTDDFQEHWVSDGKSIFQYDTVTKQVREHRLPPEMQGKAITEGPLPFLFGAKAQSLKQRYFLRLSTPATLRGKEIWLQAYPKTQQQAAEFITADLILKLPELQPTAVQLHATNEMRTVYKLEQQKINAKDPIERIGLINILKKDPFKLKVPNGWKHVLEDSPLSQAGRSNSVPRR